MPRLSSFPYTYSFESNEDKTYHSFNWPSYLISDSFVIKSVVIITAPNRNIFVDLKFNDICVDGLTVKFTFSPILNTNNDKFNLR